MSHDEQQIRYLGDVQRLVLQEGDIVVLKIPGPISEDWANRLREEMESQLPGHKVLVLGDGLEIGVLTKQDPKA